jgi:hypothetical protein
MCSYGRALGMTDLKRVGNNWAARPGGRVLPAQPRVIFDVPGLGGNVVREPAGRNVGSWVRS